MKSRSLLFGVLAAAGVAAAPAPAFAGAGPTCGTAGAPGATANLGLGGFITGCYGSIQTQGFYKQAFSFSSLYYYTNPSTIGAVDANGAPLTGTLLGNDGNGSPGPFQPGGTPGSGGPNGYITAGGINGIVNPANTAQELIFSIFNGDQKYLSFSGNAAGRNSVPAPDGIQAYLFQVTNYDGSSNGGSGYTPIGTPGTDEYYLLGFEDLNSGCQGPGLNGIKTVDWSTIKPVSGSGVLSTGFFEQADCAGITPGGDPIDFNDYFILLDAVGGGITNNITPEPMTMSMMAFGLVAMGGVSIRRRKKNSAV